MRKYLAALLGRFAQDESGISAVEYGLLAAGIAVAIYGIIGDVGSALKDIFTSVKSDLTPGSGT